MNTKHFVTLLLVGLFAVGIPAGVFAGGSSHGTDADRNLVSVWPNEGNGLNINTWEIQGPLDTGALPQAGKEIFRSPNRSLGDEPKVVEYGGVKYRIGIDDGP